MAKSRKDTTSVAHIPNDYGREPLNPELDFIRLCAQLHYSCGYDSGALALATGASIEQCREAGTHPYFRAFGIAVYSRQEYDSTALMMELWDAGVDCHRIARLLDKDHKTVRGQCVTATATPNGEVSISDLCDDEEFVWYVRSGLSGTQIAGVLDAARRASQSVRDKATHVVRRRLSGNE